MSITTWRHSLPCSHRWLWLLVMVTHASRPARFVVAQQPAGLGLSPGVVTDTVDWMLNVLNGETVLNETEYLDRFDVFFTDQVPFQVFQGGIDGLVSLGDNDDDWSVQSVQLSLQSGAAVIMAPEATDPGQAFLMQFFITSEDKILSLTLVKAPESFQFPSTMTREEAASQLSALGGYFNFVVAEVGLDEGTAGRPVCNVQAESGGDTAMPIGSMNKLYILAAVVDAVADGRITSWAQSVEIVAAFQSLPTGIVLYDTPGTTRTVQDLAELMMSISDNTAADHLLQLVGRSAVEQALVDYGHSQPELNLPFLTLRELFVLKLSGTSQDPMDFLPGPVGQAYLNATSEEERRALLPELSNIPIDTLDISIWQRPIAPEGIEWFASPMDLCMLHSMLHGKDAEADRILSLNAGIPDENGKWSYIGYKGGSEPGVLGLSWYLEASTSGDETRNEEPSTLPMVVAGALWHPSQVVNDAAAIPLFAALRDGVASETKDSSKVEPSASGCCRVIPTGNLPFFSLMWFLLGYFVCKRMI